MYEGLSPLFCLLYFYHQVLAIGDAFAFYLLLPLLLFFLQVLPHRLQVAGGILLQPIVMLHFLNSALVLPPLQSLQIVYMRGLMNPSLQQHHFGQPILRVPWFQHIRLWYFARLSWEVIRFKLFGGRIHFHEIILVNIRQGKRCNCVQVGRRFVISRGTQKGIQAEGQALWHLHRAI